MAVSKKVRNFASKLRKDMNIGLGIKNKNIPSGTKFWSPIFGTMLFISGKTMASKNDHIYCFDVNGNEREFDCEGHYQFHISVASPEVMLYPSEVESWEEFLGGKQMIVEEKKIIEVPRKKVRIPIEYYIQGTPQYFTCGIDDKDGDSIDLMVKQQMTTCGGLTLDELIGDIVPISESEVMFFNECEHFKAKPFIIRKKNELVGYLAVYR